MTESLAEYTANQVYAQEFGQAGLGVALRDNMNTYLLEFGLILPIVQRNALYESVSLHDGHSEFC